MKAYVERAATHGERWSDHAPVTAVYDLSPARSRAPPARLTSRQLAHRVGVSTKQVERWLSNGELTPYARNREDAARAFGSG